MRWSPVLVSLALLASVFAVTPHVTEHAAATHPCGFGQRYVVGDWDEDHVIRIGDAQNFARYLVGLPPGDYDFCLATLDLDCNGVYEMEDVQKIARYLVGLPYSQNEPCTDIGELL